MTTTLAHATATRTRPTMPRVGLMLGCVAGAALLVAGVWNALVQEHISVSSPPDLPAGAPPQQGLTRYLGWYSGIVPQQRADTIIAIVGAIGLVLLADGLRRRVAPTDLVGHAGCTGVALAGTVWVIGQLIGIGGHNAMASMTAHGNPVGSVASIAYTVDTMLDVCSAATFALLGVSMVAIGVAPVLQGRPRWTSVTVVTGLLSLVVAVGYVRGSDVITSDVLALLAAVLLPIWLVWTGHDLDLIAPTDAQ